MNIVAKLTEMWQYKVIVSAVLMIVAPFKLSVIILISMIIIDTLLGSYYALRIRKFTSKGFKKGLGKVLTYSITLLVVRLLELGIEGIVNTTLISKIVISYLIITETISIFENLTLLGVPLPSGIINIIMNNLGGTILGSLFKNNNKLDYMDEIEDMINYQIVYIKSEKLKTMLRIKIEEWKKTINVIDTELDEKNTDNSEIIYYKVANIINATNLLIQERWVREDIAQRCIDIFYNWHLSRMNTMMSSIKDICYSNIDIVKKKKEIIEKIIIILYQTITEIQKEETNLFKRGEQ